MPVHILQPSTEIIKETLPVPEELGIHEFVRARIQPQRLCKANTIIKREEAKERSKIKQKLRSCPDSLANSEMLKLSLEFRSYNIPLRIQKREKLPDNHDR